MAGNRSPACMQHFIGTGQNADHKACGLPEKSVALKVLQIGAFMNECDQLHFV